VFTRSKAATGIVKDMITFKDRDGVACQKKMNIKQKRFDKEKKEMQRVCTSFSTLLAERSIFSTI
jgi:hypothetical protein